MLNSMMNTSLMFFYLSFSKLRFGDIIPFLYQVLICIKLLILIPVIKRNNLKKVDFIFNDKYIYIV